jgi:uracil phosphoribosyltransferase
MDGVTVVDHPLVQHKLTLLRNKARSIKAFRELVDEIAMLLCYEVTRDLPPGMKDIEIPLASARGPTLASKKCVFAAILHARLGLLAECCRSSPRRALPLLPPSQFGNAHCNRFSSSFRTMCPYVSLICPFLRL